MTICSQRRDLDNLRAKADLWVIDPRSATKGLLSLLSLLTFSCGFAVDEPDIGLTMWFFRMGICGGLPCSCKPSQVLAISDGLRMTDLPNFVVRNIIWQVVCCQNRHIHVFYNIVWYYVISLHSFYTLVLCISVPICTNALNKLNHY